MFSDINEMACFKKYVNCLIVTADGPHYQTVTTKKRVCSFCALSHQKSQSSQIDIFSGKGIR